MSGSGLNSNMGSENQSQLPSTQPLSPLVPQGNMNAPQKECEALRLEVARLRSALDKEQAHRQQLEQECTHERQRADGYYLDRQDYKQRLRDAASAYAQLKDAYRRLRSSPSANNNPTATATAAATLVAAMTSVDATEEPEEEELEILEGSPTQDILGKRQNLAAPLLTQHNSPQAIISNIPNVVKQDEEEEKVAEEPTANALNNTVKEQPLSYSPCHRPAWKKAVRRRGEGFDNEDDQEEEEDIFLQPQAKKWAPERSAVLGQEHQQTRTAQPLVPSFPPPRPLAEPVVSREQQQQQQQQQQQPRPKGAAVFKHQEVIRKKEDREKLEGFECQDCKRFYDALEKWGAVAIGGLPQCQHRANAAGIAAGGVTGAAQQQQQQRQANMRNELRAGASRHRYLFEPPLTPKGFWDLGFDVPVQKPSQEIEKAPLRPSSAPNSFNSLG